MLPKDFPHLKPLEIELLKRLDAKINLPDNLIIDFRFPLLESEIPSNLKGSERDMYIANFQKRADFVIENEKEVIIGEIKDFANPDALGKLLMYKHLWETHFGFTKPIRLWLITQEEDKILTPLYNKHGIKVIVV
jgi:hypothetical protein